MISDVETLKKYAREGSVIRHYLEPSIKAPKSFYPAIPEGVERPECKKEHMFAFLIFKMSIAHSCHARRLLYFPNSLG